MVLAIRDVREHELDAVLALNNATGTSILPMDGAQLRHLFDTADYFRVAEIEGHLAGFLIALREDSDHASSNFLWFRQRYAHFVYIDRIVVASAYRRHGLGRVFYCDVQSYAELRTPQLTCAVFLEPRDDVVVLFHGTYGFNEVGQQVMPGSQHRVSLLAKELCSHDYIREHYLDCGGLPDLPWLRERLHHQPTETSRHASGNHA